MRIVVIPDKCTGCEACVSSCAYATIEMREGRAFITEYCQLCRACISACPFGAIIEKEETAPRRVSRVTDYKGVWVFAEHREGRVAPVAYELLGAARMLADERGAELSAVLFGADEAEAVELIRSGADRVYLSRDEAFKYFNDETYADLLTKLIMEHSPEIILAGATPEGRSFIPRVAVKLNTGLTADCTSLAIDKESGNLLQVRPAFGGNIMATIICPDNRPQIATVRPRVMKRGKYDPKRTGEIVRLNSSEFSSRTSVKAAVKEISDIAVNLQEADIIVAGGRGMGGQKGFELLGELAMLLGGAVGASRAAVDEGWISYSHQVGQTGKTVCPKIYFACGISGAVQHLVGMQSSDVIVAINSNPDAPIFGAATYGIVGDVHEIVPMLIKKIREAKGRGFDNEK